ncbi:hypothetical protein KIPE111705_11450 [Kibdelosporangium persicum]
MRRTVSRVTGAGPPGRAEPARNHHGDGRGLAAPVAAHRNRPSCEPPCRHDLCRHWTRERLESPFCTVPLELHDGGRSLATQKIHPDELITPGSVTAGEMVCAKIRSRDRVTTRPWRVDPPLRGSRRRAPGPRRGMPTGKVTVDRAGETSGTGLQSGGAKIPVPLGRGTGRHGRSAVGKGSWPGEGPCGPAEPGVPVRLGAQQAPSWGVSLLWGWSSSVTSRHRCAAR